MALTACSTLPTAAFPKYLDHHVAAEFVVGSGGVLELPSSTAQLLVVELACSPTPLAERFLATRRQFLFAPDSQVTVRSRFRTYAPDGSVPATAAAVFVGAKSLRLLEAP